MLKTGLEGVKGGGGGGRRIRIKIYLIIPLSQAINNNQFRR